MKRIIVLFVFLFFLGISTLPAFAQNSAGKVIEYMPAPGQHINIENIGTPQAAQKMVESTGSLVSLGSFGGYIILKLNEACVNHPENPYGVDFTIFGNAFSGSSEPGVVWVMKDTNLNGLPDDAWYEIAGSNHFFSGTVRDYEVTYYKTATRDVFWRDNQGNTGQISANTYNLQEYYPTPEYFPFYPEDSVSFTGTLLKSYSEKSGSDEIRLERPVFGYADSHPRVQGIDLFLPDNPYTTQIEGAGGDPVDISWAIDYTGKYVDLDSIHFVKIVSASLHVAGWLGEVSTDVAWIEATQPMAHEQGKESLLVYGPQFHKVIVGDSLKLDAFYFEKGRLADEQVIFNSFNNEVATVDVSGMVVTHSQGEVQIRISAAEETAYTAIKVVVPDSIRFITDFAALYPGDTLELRAAIYDNEAEMLNLVPRFSSSHPSEGKVITVNDKTFLVALQPGEFTLTASVDEFHLEQTTKVKILSSDNTLKVLLSVKTADENLLPLQWIDLGPADLNAFVENRQGDYSNQEQVTLFHALAQGLHKAGVPFSFRDDEAAGGELYLYKVENDGLFSYGWGGKTNPAANARAWIARLNSNQYLNDFSSIPISDGDTIFLYHVPDILSTWSFTRLLPDRLVAEAGETITILFEQTSCSYLNGEIAESGFSPVSDALINAGDSWYTDEAGRAEVFSEGDFPLVISSGNDALLITNRLTVGTGSFHNAVAVYPNPVEDWLFISGAQKERYGEGSYEIRFINSSGAVIREMKIASLPVRINLSALAPGMYQLIIADDRQLEIHKIIKR